MREIVDLGDGPEGSEDIEFAHFGVRFAVIDDDGNIEERDQFTLDMLGGILPAPGDHFAALWPTSDPNHNEHFRVLERYYVGEFAGDTCWWILVKEEVASKQDRRLFSIARAASRETRRIKNLRDAALAKELKKLGKR